MTRVELSADALTDLSRIVAHLVAHESPNTEARVDGIVAAIDALAPSPEIGRPRGDGLRELVIGRGTSGYVALYRFVPELEVVVVLAIRAQREAGYLR